MFVLLQAHSGIRYLVLLTALAVIVYALYGLVTRRPFDKVMRILGSALAGTLHLQILLGLALLFSGRFASGLAPHILAMVFAAAVAQIVPSVMRRRPPASRSYAPYLVAALVVLGLVAAGIASIGRPLLG